MYIMIICHWAILHYNMSFKTTAGRSDGVFWWFPAFSEAQEKDCRVHQNYLVALTRFSQRVFFVKRKICSNDLQSLSPHNTHTRGQNKMYSKPLCANPPFHSWNEGNQIIKYGALPFSYACPLVHFQFTEQLFCNWCRETLWSGI